MQAHKKGLKKAARWIRIRYVRLKRWWFRNDHRYGLWWRLANAVVAGLLMASIVLPVWQDISASQSYHLSADALKLVGSTDPTLTKQLSFDAQTQTYQFNKEAIKDDSTNPLAQMQAQLGTASGQGKDKSLYALDVPTDFSKGVTYHDVNSQLSFSLMPEFKAGDGKLVDGHLVFPLNGGNQGIYTLKNNGLKEDIVVDHPTTDTMSFNYQLKLPKTLAVKAIPDGSGDIGIYSGDPTLFGNISYGSDKDRAAVEKAREKADKNYLVFGLPSPVIKDTAGNDVGTARFVLNGDDLTVVASGLSDVHGAVTIDPSVVVTSTSDFQTSGNNDDNIDFGTSGQINRAGLTGGSIGSWTTNTDTGSVYQTSSRMAAVAYNGYFYVLGSDSAVKGNQVYYAALNSGGSLGAWASTTSMNLSLIYISAVAYDGYMYSYAGYNLNTSAVSGAVEYAPINSNGTVGTWTTSGNSMSSAVCRNSYAVYQGYLYAVGGSTSPAATCGNTSTGLVQTVQYAALNANGSVGSWSTTTSISYATGQCAGVSGVMSGGSVAYNGYLYSVSGTCDGAHNYATGQYAHLNSDGTVGSWSTLTTPGGGGGSRFGMVAYNGYLYIAGLANDTVMYYAPLYANGNIGTWTTTTALGSSRFGQGMAAYNGYLYLTGGSLAGASQNDTQYAQINPAGITTSYSTSGNAFTTTRRGGQAVAYNGFLYMMGGDNGGSPNSSIYAAAINTDGTIGSFTNTGMTSFTTIREYFAAVAYNGFMYVIGGCSSAYASCTTATNDLVTVYKATISSNGTIGAWAAQTSIGTATYGLSAVAYNNVIYVMGGVNGSTFQTAIQYHTLGASGAISGAWSTSAQTMPTSNEAYVGAAVNGGYLYVVGGCSAGATSCTTTTNNVYYAPLTSGGDLTSALTSTSTFTTARGDLGVFISNGYIYMTGGRTNTTYSNDLQYAPLNTNGSVGTWATSSAATLSTARYGFGAASYNGNLYVLGGYNGTTFYTDVQSVRVNNGGGGGTTGAWSSSSSFMTGRFASNSVAYNGYIYVVAGCTAGICSSVASDVQYAPLNADGTIGAWHYTENSNDDGTTFVSGLATARYGHGLVAYNGYLYALGGCSAGLCTGLLNDVQYAPLNANGTVGTWQATTSFTTARMGLGAVAYKGYLYVLGGCTSASSGCITYANDVQYAPINSDGTVGTWNSANSFTTTRWFFGSVAYNGYLYIMGGANPTNQNDVQYALICTGSNSGTGGCSSTAGTVGTWKTTTSFINARYGLGATAYDGFMYILGGNTGSLQNDVQFAPILANGALGNWQNSTTFTTARYEFPAVTSNGNAYLLGGCSLGVCSTFQNDTQYVPLNAIARVGHYSKLIDLSAAVNVTSITYNGAIGSGSVMYRAAGSSGVLGSLGSASSVSGSGGCLGTTTNTRYIWLLVTLDDTTGVGGGGTFTDSTGLISNLTDVTVNYNPVHPAPNIRLRAGQTLQSGNLSALDTCGP